MHENLIRLLAITLSLSLHAALFVRYGSAQSFRQIPPNSPTLVTHLSFAAPVTIIPHAPDPVMQPEPVIKSQKKRKQTTKKKSHIHHAKKREKLKPPTKPAPVQNRITRKLSPIMPPRSRPVRLASISNPVIDVPAIDTGRIEQDRQRYLAEVKARINARKRYPRAARRRSITGDVRIAFQLLLDGGVQHISVESGPEILQHAAEQSVRKALPMPAPPSTIHFPLHCEFVMRYALR